MKELKDLDLSYSLFLVIPYRRLLLLHQKLFSWLLRGLSHQIGLGLVGMTQVGSKKISSSRWTPSQILSGTKEDTSGSNSMSLKLCECMSQVQSRVGSVLILGGL